MLWLCAVAQSTAVATMLNHRAMVHVPKGVEVKGLLSARKEEGEETFMKVKIRRVLKFVKC